MANIRWRTKDIYELESEIDRYNRKVLRERRKGNESDLFDIIPDFADMKEKITTRAQYKDLLQHIRIYTQRGSEKQYAPAAEKGVQLTVAEKNELDRRVAIINKDRNRMRREFAKRGREDDRFKPRHDIRQTQLGKKKTVDEQLQGKTYKNNFARYKESVKKQSSPDYMNQRFDQYKESYISKCQELLGRFGAEIIAKVEKIEAETFYYLSLAHPELSIDFLYDPISIKEKVEMILAKLSELGY